MSYMRFNYRSQALGYYVDVSVVYPTDNYSYYDLSAEKPPIGAPVIGDRLLYKPGMKFQTVYLIHGGGDDDSLTYRYTNAERYAQANNVMLVTPSIPNSFGVDAEYGVNYQTFIAKELPTVIQSLFASSPKREDNFIMGYAMGGNVALGTAIANQDTFAACVDISGGIGLTLDTEKLKSESGPDGRMANHFYRFTASFGDPDKIDGSRFDLYSIAKKRKEEGKELTKFYIICGEKERIRQRVEGDVRCFKELDYDFEYIVPEGYDHDFDMWNDHIKYALNELLPLRRKPYYPDED